jgi:hypothetical protein
MVTFIRHIEQLHPANQIKILKILITMTQNYTFKGRKGWM